MSKSIVYASNSSAQTVVAGGTVNFGTADRRYGCNCYMSGGNAITRGCGYYAIDANITFLAGAAGTATLTLYKDGVAIPGATQSLTVAADTTYAFAVPAVVRNLCDCENVITAIITGVATTVNNAAIRIVK